MRLFGIRGATGAENTKESVIQNVGQMFSELVKENNLKSEDIVSIQFTITDDLTLMNPAAALRRGNPPIDVSRVPLFCSQEPKIEGSPEKMIRVLITTYLEDNAKVVPVYINGGEKLRPDFAAKKN
ncbi:MAG: chorismate mutase [Treponema sp.]|nr:chorismate mutase [Treponema sp.]